MLVLVLVLVVLLVLLIVLLVLMLLRLRVVVLDWDFDDPRLHVILVRHLFDDVNLVRHPDFFYHRHFDFLDDGVLLDVMMMDCVDSVRHFVLYFSVRGETS